MEKMGEYKPSPYFTWSVHLDGMKEDHDKAVCQDGVFDRCVSAIKKAKSLGFRCNINCTIFDNVKEESLKEFFELCYCRFKSRWYNNFSWICLQKSSDQQHFIKRSNTKKFF